MKKEEKCVWCGKTYQEHDNQRPIGAPIPRVPCLMLKSNFVARKEKKEEKESLEGILRSVANTLIGEDIKRFKAKLTPEDYLIIRSLLQKQKEEVRAETIDEIEQELKLYGFGDVIPQIVEMKRKNAEELNKLSPLKEKD